MQRRVRDSRAGYMQSLDVLRAAKAVGVYTKSSVMLGLGETDEEVRTCMQHHWHVGMRLDSRFGMLLLCTPCRGGRMLLDAIHRMCVMPDVSRTAKVLS